jgi:RNA polymerase sigma factor for flagellar operon FliA
MSQTHGHVHEADQERMHKAASRAYEASASLTSEERDRLLMEQLPQVQFIARRIHDRLPHHVALEDLVQAGIVGLIEAIHKYDPSKHVQLKTYAKFRIRGAILDSLRALDWSPRALRRKARELEGVNARLRARLERSATETEVAAELGMTLEALQTLLGDLRGLDLGSLQAVTSVDGYEVEVQVAAPASSGDDPFNLCLKAEMNQHLAHAIRELPEKEALVLSFYHYEELTMKEVGAVLGVGEARVSQIHTSALIHLRERLRELLGTPNTAAGPWQRGEEVQAATWKRS